MRTIDLFEEMEDNNLTLIDALRDFLPLAAKHLNLPGIPKIKLEKHIDKSNVPTFGRFTNEDDTVYVAINNRNPNDILRTLAHELQHFKQRTEHELAGGSWHTGSPAENQAHEMAGIIMREFNAKYPQYLRMKPVVLPDNAPSKELDESDSVLTHAGFRETADIKTRDDFLGKRDELYRRLGDEKDPENLKALRQELRNLERLYPNYVTEAEAWQTKKGKNKNGGLNKKGVASYRRSHPGSKLQTAVTTKPSKLKKGSKSAKRRKSFCARMKGMKKSRTSAKTARDPNSRINKALRKWHCESIEDMRQMIILGEQYIAQLKEGQLDEKWSAKYKRSINCSHPKGFSQKAHCAGKKKHNESVEMEMTCPDCGMCQTHGNISEIKQRLDAKCWKGKHKEGTKIKGGIRVNNCVPNK